MQPLRSSILISKSCAGKSAGPKSAPKHACETNLAPAVMRALNRPSSASGTGPRADSHQQRIRRALGRRFESWPRARRRIANALGRDDRTDKNQFNGTGGLRTYIESNA